MTAQQLEKASLDLFEELLDLAPGDPSEDLFGYADEESHTTHDQGQPPKETEGMTTTATTTIQGMTPRQAGDITRVLEATRFHGLQIRRLQNLFGPSLKEQRREIVRIITGEKRPLAQCGIGIVWEVAKTSLQEAGFEISGCLSEQHDQVNAAIATLANQEKVMDDAAAISSGTLSVITGERNTTRLDEIQAEFVRFCSLPENRLHESWQAAWEAWQTTDKEDTA